MLQDGPVLSPPPPSDATKSTEVDRYSLRNNPTELANAITHGLGFVLSLLAAAVLMTAALARGDAWQIAACAVYATTMVAVYGASTASHVFLRPRANRLWRMIDQGCIYLFIAGTFLPIAATFLRTGFWWLLPAAMWCVALWGFARKMMSHRIDSASVIVPVLLGWMPLIGGPPMLAVLPVPLLYWMLAGGVCYTVGTLFLMNDTRHIYLHAVWHLFVIAGSICHFIAIWRYTLPTV